MATNILTPVGRLVQGDCFTPQEKDNEGRPLRNQSGEPAKRWFIGVAIPKTDPGVGQLWQTIVSEARAGFPAMFDASGNCTRRDFAFKMIDGDGVDNQGKPYGDREGFAGCWIFKFASGFAPKCFTAGGASAIVDPNSIKRGYYVRVAGSVSPNGSQTKPGVYLNLNMVELVAYGEEIVSGPDAAAVFGGAPVAQLPPGATTTPPAPTTTIAQPGAAPAPAVAPAAMPAMPGGAPAPTAAPAPAASPAPAPAATPAPAPQPAATAAPAPGAVAPAPDFLNPPAAAPAPAPSGPRMTEKATTTYEAYVASGWTDAQLVEHGLMVAG